MSGNLHIHIERLYYIDHTCLDLLKAAALQRSERGGKLDVAWDVLNDRYEMHDLSRPAARAA